MSGYALHRDPAWRQRANFIINAQIDGSSDVHTEQLWTRHDMAKRLYEVCCIPFFIYDLSLGDLVAVRVSGDGAHVLEEVVESSGNLTFRVFFADGESGSQAEVMEDLAKAPILIERYSASLVAISISESDSPQRLADYLAQAEDDGRLVYETGRTLDSS